MGTVVLRFLCCIFLLVPLIGKSASILIPMDARQKNHLKAYGIAYLSLQSEIPINWLLNYRGGSFLFPYDPLVENECSIRGVSFDVISDGETALLMKEIESPRVNMNSVKMEKEPRIAVYSPKNDMVEDNTDAVITALDYAEIPYTIIYDTEVLSDSLVHFDWLHLHHEDFTGQFGRHLRRQSSQIEAKIQEATAASFGYSKVSDMKLAVAKKIQGFTLTGGYLFAMCSGAETFDIALAAEGVDIVESMYDGDGMDPQAQQKLDFSKTFAFTDFILDPPNSRRFSNINTSEGRRYYYDESSGYFSLFDFSAKWDIVPSLLTQNHTAVVKSFFGQTTAFAAPTVKSDVLILGENADDGEVRYIYGEMGYGHWTFYSGHDPERSPGGWREQTNLDLYPNSPGYRLILNNVLFPSAQKKKQKT
ncbi:MAG: asparagine synthetase B [Imperialibacter sp.]|uniref:asparagine synthetase B n=1 Tax=Imperialibacter sp. TaxID=2038411 RepID=UPI0032ED1D6E